MVTPNLSGLKSWFHKKEYSVGTEWYKDAIEMKIETTIFHFDFLIFLKQEERVVLYFVDDTSLLPSEN